ncbi:hypothetical protein EI94DRAFT_1561006, partial [Lactarius quietus]
AFVGRARFGCVTFELESGILMYLKACWRVDDPEIPKEEDIYRELYNAQVQNIATLGRAGDVRDITSPDLQWQMTRIQYYSVGSLHTWSLGQPSVEKRIHCRLVLETIRMRLNQFKSTRQLVEVIPDALVGMEHTFFCCPPN